MSDRPILQTSDLDNLISALDVNVIALTECHISEGWTLSFPSIELPCIHYSLAGQGRMKIGEQMPISIAPHKLVVSPPRQPFWIGASIGDGRAGRSNIAKAAFPLEESFKRIQNFVAGKGSPELVMVCGCFRTSYAASIDLFTSLVSPIVEQFSDADELERNLKLAMAELSEGKVGMRAMAAALLKLVLVRVLRRFLGSHESQSERFTMLNDPQIARAFSDMARNPGASHSVQSLSSSAGLSRSVFMRRFVCAYGESPIALLRQLRMRKAAALLEKGVMSVEQVAKCVGYESRSSFFRAFKEAYGTDPTAYVKEIGRRPVPSSVPNEVTEDDRESE